MTLRAPPGELLSTGHIRVDAARAVAKLREYQLADRTAWVLEAVRAAVASGARAIDLRGDSNDVWVRWEGEPWPDEVLPALFDELVSPEPASDRQHLRLLGTAVNSALGLAPVYVDVTAIHADRAARVRYTPDVLELPDGDATPALRRVVVQASDTDGPPGMLLHLRRPAGLETLALLLRGGEPPEMVRARERCATLAIPVRVGGVDLAAADLVSVPLGEGLDGFLAITPMVPVPAPHAMMEVAEHGVVLARYPLDLGVELSLSAVPLPVRLFLDAPRMPTNASRSDVRHDSYPINAARARARVLWPALLARLAEVYSATPTEPLRAAALAILGSVTAGASWAFALFGEELPAPYRAVAALRLVRNAVGKPRPARSAWIVSAVHTGEDAFPEKLAPWLGEVLWSPPGDPSRWIFEGAVLDAAVVRRLGRGARRRARAHARFLRHARREPRLEARVDHLAVVRLDAPGYEGEVALLPSGGGRITLLYEERVLAVIERPTPVPYEAIVATTEVTPLESYRGVQEDSRVVQVETEVRSALVSAAEDLARRDPPESLLEALRRSFLLLGVLVPASSLATLRCWPTVDGDRVSLADLQALPVVGVARALDRSQAPSGRTVVLVEDELRAKLTSLLEPATKVVRYQPRGTSDGDHASSVAARLAWQEGVTALAVRERDARGAIAWGVREARISLSHMRAGLATIPAEPTLATYTIMLDSDLVVPDEAWTHVRDLGGALQRDLGTWERAMAIAVAGALLGDRVPDLYPLTRPLRLDSPAVQTLLAVFAAHDPDLLLGGELAERLRAHPMWTVAGASALQSADALAATFPTSIPMLGAPPELDTGAWQPVIADGFAAGGLARLARREVHAGEPELARRQRDAVRARNIAVHAARPVVPLTLPRPTAQLELEGPAVTGVVGVGQGRRTEIYVHIDGRPFQLIVRENDLPLTAVVEVAASCADPAFVALDETEAWKVVREVSDTATPLLVEIARAAPHALDQDEHVRALLIEWVAHVGEQSAGTEKAARAAIREAPTFVAIQGGRHSIKQASEGGRARIASWLGAWLDAGDEPPDALDGPVLYVADGPVGDEQRALLAGLSAARAVVDVTVDVRRLQTARRMARGTIDTPRVRMGESPWKRKLGELGDDARAFGLGELALVDSSESIVLVHESGGLVGEIVVDVRPSVRLAIEAPELADELAELRTIDTAARDSLAQRTQALTRTLVRVVLDDCDPGWIPSWLIESLRRARLADRLTPEELAGLPVFETTGGATVAWAAVESQQRTFGNVWYAARDCQTQPLDETRIALRLGDADLVAAAGSALTLIDATIELQLDAQARANLAVPLATSLDLTASDLRGALAVVELTGDLARGKVAVLAPGAEGLRGVRVHRAMQPLGFLVDPCDWPTLAIIDDPHLTADRTWSAPVDDERWRHLTYAIKTASEQALGKFADAPPDALARRQLRAGQSGLSQPMLVAGVRARGRLWIAEPAGSTVTVLLDQGQRRVMTAVLPVRGEVVVFLPLGVDPQTMLDELARATYPEMVRSASRAHGSSPAVVEHLIRALDAGVLDVAQVKQLKAPGAAALARRSPPEPEIPIEVAPMERVPRRHPLDALAHALLMRLEEIGAGAHIRAVQLIDGDEPLVLHREGVLFLAMGSRLLAGRATPALIDALAAHALTVLNHDLTAVTDATELHLVGQLLARVR